MSVKIRLERTGSKGQPSYRIVVVDERAARSGNAIEVIGHYNPRVEPSLFEVDRDKVTEWIKKGAQPTAIVRKMLGKAGVLKQIDYSTYKKRAPRQKKSGGEEAPKAEAPKAEAPKAAPKAEAPKAEAPKAEEKKA